MLFGIVGPAQELLAELRAEHGSEGSAQTAAAAQAAKDQP